MNLYLVRALKCFLKLAILLALVFAAMSLTGTLNTGGLSMVQALFASTRGLVLLGVIVVWSAVYPIVSFCKVSVRMEFDRERLVDAFATYAYEPESESEAEGQMTFRCTSTLRKILWQFDDRVTVTRDGGFVDIEGLKRIVPRVESRLKSMMR